MSSELTERIAPFRVLTLPILALVLLGPTMGCGANGAGTMPSLVPVTGKVTFKGQPLTTGTVRFEPDDYGRPATGKLQSDGTFVLTTLTDGDGVVAGHHRVSIFGTDPKAKPAASPRSIRMGRHQSSKPTSRPRTKSSPSPFHEVRFPRLRCLVKSHSVPGLDFPASHH